MMQISISLKNNNDRELITKELLESILEKYKLDKWILCRDVIIEQGASGKAFPLIRLSAFRSSSIDNEGKLLAQFLHEQIHWITKDKEEQMENAIVELKKIFPNVPIDKPEGGGSEKSTYIHLIVCRLELLALKELLGEEVGDKIVSGNSNYTWIRKTVMEKGNKIDPIINKYFPKTNL